MGNYFAKDADGDALPLTERQGTTGEVVESKGRHEVERVPGGICQGTMYKQPISASKEWAPKRWKERFFILVRGALFYYSYSVVKTIDATNTTSAKMGVVCNSNATASNTGNLSGSAVEGGKLGHSFVVVVNGEDAEFVAQTRSLAQEWVDFFNERHSKGGSTGEKAGNLSFGGTSVHVQVERTGTMTLRLLYQLGHFPVSAETRVKPALTEERVFHIVTGDRVLTCMCDSDETSLRWQQGISLMCNIHHHPQSDEAHVIEFYNTLHHVLQRAEPIQTVPPLEADAATVAANPKKPFLILSIDGGGTRGLLCCVILERLVKQYPELLSRVSMFAGTSNGSMIAAALATGYQPHTIREMLELTAHSIFSEKQTRYSVTVAKWSNRFLALLCQHVWKDAPMSLAFKPLLIPSFLLDSALKRCPGGTQEDRSSRCMEISLATSFGEGKDEKISDIVLRSCAAPTYFPSWQGYVDGGVFCHNPSDVALARAVSELGQDLSNVYILSLSTGHVKRFYPADDLTTGVEHNWGMLYWGQKLLSTIWFGMIEKTNDICRNLIGDRFFRIDPELTDDVEFDNPESLLQMIYYGQNADLSACFTWLQQLPPNK